MRRNWIKLNDKNRDKITYFIEQWYPFALSVIVVVIYLFLFNINIVDDIDTIINAVISFASILVGFIGTLLALLFSLNNNPIVKFIFKDEHYNKLMKKFFIRVFQSGFILIVCSLVLFLRKTINNIDFFNLRILYFNQEITILIIIKIIWIFSLSYFGSSSYRIILIITKIAFTYNNINEDDKADEGEELDIEEYEKLKKDNEIERIDKTI